MLNELLKRIKTGELLQPKLFNNLDEDTVLDFRDEPEFENEWLRISDILDTMKVDSKNDELIYEIRKHSFINVYNTTKSDELSAYISDDFELISKAIVLGYNDKWLNSLILSYANFKFPYILSELTNLSIDEVTNKLITPEAAQKND